MTPEQIAARFGAVAKKTVPGETSSFALCFLFLFFSFLCCLLFVLVVCLFVVVVFCLFQKKPKILLDALIDPSPVQSGGGGRITKDGPDFESLARRSHNTMKELGGPPSERRTKREEEFERSVMGSRGAPGVPESDNMDAALYRAGEERFAQVRQRREQMQSERERRK